jgi:hypothetical protein
MLVAIEEKSSDLEKLANDVFGLLSPAEQGLLRHSQRAIPSSCKRDAPPQVDDRRNAVRSLQEGSVDRSLGGKEDENLSKSRRRLRNIPPAGMDTAWVRERSVRSELLHWLCTDSAASKCLNDFSIELIEKRVQGRLNLSRLDIPFSIICRSCWFPDGIDLDGAEITDLILDGSWIGPPPLTRLLSDQPPKQTTVFSAEGLVAKGSVLLRGVHAEGEVNLIGAEIRGDLSCSEGEFNGAETSLVLDRAKIGGNLNLREKFTAKGPVRLMGSTIQGDLDCRSGSFECDSIALAARGVTVNGSVFLCTHKDTKFEANGEVGLHRTHIGGDVNCMGGVFNGEFGLFGAEIGGQLICTGSEFHNPGGWALNAEQAVIHGAVFLGFALNEIQKDPALKAKTGFLAQGGVRFFGASLGSSLICHAGRLRNLGGIALDAENAKLTGGMMLRFGFDAEGEVRLFGTDSLECREASFRNPGENCTALRLDRTTVGGTVDLSSGFQVEGEALIHSATINSVHCASGTARSRGC